MVRAAVRPSLSHFFLTCPPFPLLTVRSFLISSFTSFYGRGAAELLWLIFGKSWL